MTVMFLLSSDSITDYCLMQSLEQLKKKFISLGICFTVSIVIFQEAKATTAIVLKYLFMHMDLIDIKQMMGISRNSEVVTKLSNFLSF